MAKAQNLTTSQQLLGAEDDVVGLAAGTGVMTQDGMIPVEFLHPGDRVITRDGGLSVLRGLMVREHRDVAPVRIRARVLGHNRPAEDVTVAPDQLILVRGWKARALYDAESVLVPAARLADGTHISMGPAQTLRYFSLMFDAPHIIYAEDSEVAMPVTIDDLV